jgi:murein DD-endopeptidase MepM/ murein hydrolase activator NlpD
MSWNAALRGVFVLVLVSVVSACAVRPIQSSRRGLLDGEEPRSIARRMASVEVGTRTLGNVTLPGKWQWPLKEVEISSTYGERGGKFHQGVDLRARIGTPVMAAAAGEVVYVGSKIRGYGRMVVLKHENGFYTVYAHHSKNLVKLGNRVEQGQVIAHSGKSGRSFGAHLHFELRRGAQSIDPEYAFNGYFKVPANRKIASKSGMTHEFED